MKALLVSLFGFCFVNADVVPSAESAEGHRLFIEGWERPVGTRAKIESRRSISRGRMKVSDESSWTTGVLGSVETQELTVEHSAEKSFTIDYQKSQNSYRMLHDGFRQNQLERSPLEGLRLIVTDGAEGWEAEVDGAVPETTNDEKLAKALKLVEESMDDDYAPSLLGLTARAVGEAWTVAQPRLPGAGSEKILRGEAKVIFEKVAQFGGEKCAFLKVIFDYTSEHIEDTTYTVTYRGEGRIVRSLQSFIDFDYKANGFIRIVNQLGEGERIETSGDCELARKITLVKPTPPK